MTQDISPVWREALLELNPDALTADGFDDAYVGCIEALMREGMSYEEAVDFFEFNVAGAYVGPNTPLFLIDREGD